MADKTVLYEWLERWEQALDGPVPADLDEFIRQNCQGSDPVLIAEFRRWADNLRWMKSLLGALGAPADTGRESPGSTDPRPGARPALQPGQEVVPGYPLERLLGEGNFGEVWQARSPTAGSVALKFVRLSHRGIGKEQRGLEVMSQSRHPHLLSVLRSWQTGGYLVIAMELADRTLADRLRQAQAEGHAGIPRGELLRYFEQAADALDYLNRPHPGPDGQELPGSQHRDIKPENLLLVGDALKVGDFGLARCLETSVARHTGGLTPAYAAPEFFDGEFTRQSDQYCLAVTWCMLRGGRLPFQGSDAKLMAGHVQGHPDLTMLPEMERAPVRRALAKQSTQRWPSCQEFVAALRACADLEGLRFLGSLPKVLITDLCADMDFALAA
jgi:serine/threonine protein kinase